MEEIDSEDEETEHVEGEIVNDDETIETEANDTQIKLIDEFLEAEERKERAKRRESVKQTYSWHLRVKSASKQSTDLWSF